MCGYICVCEFVQKILQLHPAFSVWDVDMYLLCVLFSDAAVPDGDAHAQSHHHGEHHAALSAHPAGTHQAGPGHLPGQKEGQ